MNDAVETQREQAGASRGRVAIDYDRRGAGPPLVLLHGVGHHRQAWRPVVELLCDEFDTLACDSPGFGSSPPLPAGTPRTIAAYADAFEGLFAELGLGRPHVAGNSMGASIALELASRHAVRSASAFSPAGFWTKPEREFARASLTVVARTPRALRPAALELARTRPGRRVLFWQLFGWPLRMPVDEGVSALRDAWNAPSFLDVLHAFRDYRVPPAASLRDVPITIAWGVHDRLLPYALQAPRARALLPFAEHVAIGGGHLPFFDDPAAMAQVIRSCAGRAAGDGLAQAAASPPATLARATEGAS